MTDTHLAIKDLIIDCVDAERVAAFWAELLGRPVAARTGPYVWLTRGPGPGVGFQQVAAPTPGKNRVHFDVAAADPASARRRIEALGGRHLREYAAGGFLVMADPEGNEFCVIPPGPFEVDDDDGRADYLGTAGSPASA
ncbi:VOC family protein [Streptomyces sp. DH12]|uniref:VOC family protein n=1 Tax=Streptomyces sp. DH12 TaxID=2857010 RepID=UPI001E40A5F4|nr:VOC family protein [Streptomyces sp. DH12]